MILSKFVIMREGDIEQWGDLRAWTDLRSFARYWLRKNKLQPEKYPLEMNEMDWETQLDIFENRSYK